MLVSLALTLALVAAPPPPSARAVWRSDIGEAWRAALPAQSPLPLTTHHARRGTTIAVLADAADAARLARALPRHAALPAFDPARELALVVFYDGASQLDFHGFDRVGRSGVVRWAPSPNWVAFQGPQLLVIILPRAGLDRLSVLDVSIPRRQVHD